MDTSRQLYEEQATGWKDGLYDDIKTTLRAPIVNWVFRTLMANEPAFTRYLWGQVKPLFTTAAFAEFSAAYRDAVLSAVEADHDLPTYRREAVDVSPAEYRELRGQVETFDVVIPRLAVLFETIDRTLLENGDPAGVSVSRNRATAAPLPTEFDSDRGLSVTMTSAGNLPASLDDTVASIRSFHGFEGDLPSIYRCLLQWPTFAEALWTDVEPILRDEAFDRAGRRASETASAFVDEVPYRPRLGPDDLRDVELSENSVSDLQEFFQMFTSGPAETVLPAVPLFAATVDANGPRE